jgi:hypothetical protein
MVHDQIYKLRRQYSELEKRAETLVEEAGKINILKQIEQLQITIKTL